MKNSEVASAIIGGTFFAIPYLALSVPILPSLVIGSAAFCAGELALKNSEKIIIRQNNKSIDKKLSIAIKQNEEIYKKINLIEDENICNNLKEIYNSVNRIISTIKSNTKKIKHLDNFFDYYLPSTVKIVNRYDEIENQKLSSSAIKKLKNDTNKMIEEINDAFKNILNSLYESDIIDIDTDMKVFDAMLKSDGYDNNSLSVKSKEE